LLQNSRGFFDLRGRAIFAKSDIATQAPNRGRQKAAPTVPHLQLHAPLLLDFRWSPVRILPHAANWMDMGVYLFGLLYANPELGHPGLLPQRS
jgi:hypothetical protein